MKKMLVTLIILLSSLTFSVEIKTAAQESAPKFFIKENKKEIIGICIDVMRELEKEDPSIKFTGDQIFLPFNRIEVELEKGNIDSFVGLAKSDEREKKYIFIDTPIYYVKNILISRADDKIKIEKLEELKKIKDNVIVVSKGTIQAKTLKKEGYNIDESGNNLESSIKKLLLGRGRFVYQSEIEILDIIKKMKVEDKIKIQPVELKESGRYIAFSKNTSPKLIDKINKIMKKMKASGKLDEIVKKYSNGL